ncbi:hypothetical protein RUND412_003932 [Rhizina undulata]
MSPPTTSSMAGPSPQSRDTKKRKRDIAASNSTGTGDAATPTMKRMRPMQTREEVEGEDEARDSPSAQLSLESALQRSPAERLRVGNVEEEGEREEGEQAEEKEDVGEEVEVSSVNTSDISSINTEDLSLSGLGSGEEEREEGEGGSEKGKKRPEKGSETQSESESDNDSESWKSTNKNSNSSFGSRSRSVPKSASPPPASVISISDLTSSTEEEEEDDNDDDDGPSTKENLDSSKNLPPTSTHPNSDSDSDSDSDSGQSGIIKIRGSYSNYKLPGENESESDEDENIKMPARLEDGNGSGNEDDEESGDGGEGRDGRDETETGHASVRRDVGSHGSGDGGVEAGEEAENEGGEENDKREGRSEGSPALITPKETSGSASEAPRNAFPKSKSKSKSDSKFQPPKPQLLSPPEDSTTPPPPPLKRFKFKPSPPKPEPTYKRTKGGKRGKQVDRHNDKYIALLNEEIENAVSHNIYEPPDGRGTNLSTSVLESWWTPEEKFLFFNRLATAGKDNIPAIAAAVGTKSVVECRAFIKALEEGVVDANQDKSITLRRQLIRLPAIPAAVELSEECVRALEEAADNVEDRIQRNEQKREKARWGEFWLINPVTSWHVQALYEADEIEEVRKIAPEAELLNVYEMLRLAECLFMNGPKENSWQKWSLEPPNIRYAALADFHKLVVSFTRRIVQTTIFMAQSRQRSLESKIFQVTENVRADDVKAALNCMGLPLNSKEYWARFPRRTGISVVEKLAYIRQGETKPPFTMSYDKVEAELLPKVGVEGEDETESSGNEGDDEDDEDYDSEDDEVNKNDELDDDAETPDGEPTSSSELSDDSLSSSSICDYAESSRLTNRQRERAERDEMLQEAEDEYLEATDAKASIAAEKELWKLLGKEIISSSPPSSPSASEPSFPRQQRKRKHELVDWRDETLYRAPWETLPEKRLKRSIQKLPVSVSDAPISLLESVVGPAEKRHEVYMKKANKILGKDKSKGKGEGKEKEQSVRSRSPRKSRVRRRPSQFEGFVSTVENVSLDSDVEALAREFGDDESESGDTAGDNFEG